MKKALAKEKLMKKVLLSFLVTLFFFAPLGASAQEACVDICEDCDITEENIEYWRLFDLNGSGGLTAADLLALRRFQQNTGIECINETVLSTITKYDIDVTDDGVFDGEDWAVINAFSDYFWLTGDDSITVQEFIDCLQTVILGTCP